MSHKKLDFFSIFPSDDAEMGSCTHLAAKYLKTLTYKAFGNPFPFWELEIHHQCNEVKGARQFLAALVLLLAQKQMVCLLSFVLTKLKVPFKPDEWQAKVDICVDRKLKSTLLPQ